MSAFFLTFNTERFYFMPLKPKKESTKASDQLEVLKTERGPDLRQQMEESERYGQQVRAQNQGADAVKANVKHEESNLDSENRKTLDR